MLNMNQRTQRGLGLIESMISIFVVSIGFLGFAGLQVKGLAATNDSLFRSKAIYLSSQMADRVRANVPGTQAGSYNSLTGTTTSPGCITTSCTAVQVAQNDFYEWTTEVAQVLPSGSAVICLDSTPNDGAPGDAQCDAAGNVFTIKLWWAEQGTQRRFVTTFRP